MLSHSQPTNTPSSCPTCGGPLASGRLGSQCPACLLNLASTLGLGGNADLGDALLDPFQVRTFGDYELLEEVARGGMGVVYRARQLSLGREVAIKMILAGERAGRESLAFFQREAQAAALLHHPHIVPVYEIGEHETQHYFTMRFVRGGQNIAHWAAERRHDYRALARALAQATRAVAYAHSHGVLHRDLKPSNILWDAETGPQLTDFGLAKLMDAPASSFTLEANAIGSPGYMAPEQAEGRVAEITTATDVYGLGTVLYEMLSGRAPFAGGSLLETIRRAAEKDPDPLPAVPKDLRTICFKCLAKNPADRYRSAASLADDLERFARGEPVSAVPLTPMQTAWRWARRHPAMAGMLGVTSAVLIAGVTGIAWQWRAAVSARRGETEALRRATGTVVDLYTHSGINAAGSDDPTRAALWFAQAANTTLDAARQAEELGRQMAWRLGANTCVRAFESGVGPVGQIRWNRAQTAVVTQARRGQRCAVWEVAAEKRWQPDSWAEMELAAWANHTNWLAFSTGSRVAVAAFPSAQPIASVATDTPATALAISPDDRWIAVGTSAPFLWEVTSGKRTLLPGGLGVLSGLEFSRNGRYLLLTGNTNRGVCALTAPGEFLTPPVEAHALADVGFLGDGETYFSTTPRGKVKVYETGTGKQLESYPTSSDTNETVAAVSPDGRFLARHSQPLIVRSGEPLDFPRHKNRFEAVDFSADGQWLASGSFDTTLQLWALDGNGTSKQVGWHQHGITAVAFSPDQRHLAAAQYEGALIRIWRLGEPVPHRSVPLQTSSDVQLSPDGKWFVPSGRGGEITSLRRTRVYDTTEATPVGPELDPGGTIMDAAFAPDASWLAILCLTEAERTGATPSPGAGNLQFWDFRRGVRLGEPIPLPAEPRGLSVHPSGQWIGLYDAEARLSEVQVGTRELKPLARQAEQAAPAFGRCRYSPDGALLVGWGLNRSALFWDRQAAQVRQPAVPSPTHVMDVAFYSNVVATVSLQSRIDFLRVPDLQPVAPSIQDSDWLFVGRFSEDGAHFLSAGRGNRARLWNWRQGTLLCPALQHDHEVFGAAFIPGTPWVATGDLSRQIRFWDHETGLPVRPPVEQECGVMQLVATPDGHSLLRGNFRGQGLRRYGLAELFPRATLPPADALLLAEIDAAAEVLQGGLEPLTAAEWIAKWREFRARQPGWHRW